MAVWAYRCYSCIEGEGDWFVSQLDAERLQPEIRIVRVRVGRDWKCAVLDRKETVVVNDQLVRDVIASDESDCPECAVALEADTIPEANDSGTEAEPSPSASSSPGSQSRNQGMKVQAAAISLQGQQFVVLVSKMSLITSPGEADMAIEDLQPYFGGVPIVLMAQKEDGSVSYYGDSALVESLQGVPIDQMPWKEYTVG